MKSDFRDEREIYKAMFGVAGKRGYANVVPFKDAYPKQTFKKPSFHQKVSSHSIFRKLNPLAAAMDAPLNSDVVRPLPQVPPLYLDHMSHINQVASVFKYLDGNNISKNGNSISKQRIENQTHNQSFDLRFSSDVIKERCEWPFAKPIITENALKKEEEGLEKLKKEAVLYARHDPKAYYVHKSQWNKEFKLESSEYAKKNTNMMFDDLDNPTRTALLGSIIFEGTKKSESLKKNLPYMLDIWQKAEGVDLEKLLLKEFISDKKKETLPSNLTKLSKRPTTPNSLNQADPFNLTPVSKIGETTLEEREENPSEEKNEGNLSTDLPVNNPESHKPRVSYTQAKPSIMPIQKENDILENHVEAVPSPSITPITPPPKKEPLQTLSNSTLILLKKLVSSTCGETFIEANPDFIDTFLRNTLTGSSKKDANGEPEDPFSIDVGYEANGNTFNTNNSGRVRRKRKTKRSKREVFELEGILGYEKTGDFVMENKDDDEIENSARDYKVQLYIPNITEICDAPVTADRSTLLSTVDGKLTTDLGLMDAVAQSKMRSTILATSPKMAAAEYISLANLASLCKAKLTNLKLKKYSNTNVYQVYPDHPSGPTITKLDDILATEFITMHALPVPDTPAYSVLHKTLALCLREKNNRPLRFEATILLLKINGSRLLQRWDAISFQDTLSEMLLDGVDDEKLFAAKALCLNKKIDYQSISIVIELGLGNNDELQSEESFDILCQIDFKYIPETFKSLLAHADSTSWRVRRDVIRVMIKLLKRLSSGSLLKINSNIEQHQSQYIDSLTKKITELFLEMMWNDWSPHVRSTATDALAKLGVGKPIFEWIIKLLQNNDPIKRMEALGSLGQLGILTPKALPVFLEVLDDAFINVRIKACKIACVLATNHRLLINKLLDRCDDFEWRIRAYAIKAIGLSGCDSPAIRETIQWMITYEKHPCVKAEAIRATREIPNMSEEIKEALLLLLEDKNEGIRKEAEASLTKAGVNIAPPTKFNLRREAELEVEKTQELAKSVEDLLGACPKQSEAHVTLDSIINKSKSKSNDNLSSKEAVESRPNSLLQQQMTIETSPTTAVESQPNNVQQQQMPIETSPVTVVENQPDSVQQQQQFIETSPTTSLPDIQSSNLCLPIKLDESLETSSNLFGRSYRKSFITKNTPSNEVMESGGMLFPTLMQSQRPSIDRRRRSIFYAGKTDEEIEIIGRDQLVENKEQQDVIKNVHDLNSKEKLKKLALNDFHSAKPDYSRSGSSFTEQS